jgi:RimJ/RimL family protein N-acetyltransferase
VEYLIAPDRRAADGFVLRSYEVADGPLLSDALNESYEHLRAWLPWPKQHQTIEESERKVREFRGRYLLAQDFTLGIFSADEQRLLGGTGFNLREGPISAGLRLEGVLRGQRADVGEERKDTMCFGLMKSEWAGNSPA